MKIFISTSKQPKTSCVMVNMQTTTTRRLLRQIDCPKTENFTTISPFKRYKFLLRTLFVRLSVGNKSPFDGLTIRPSDNPSIRSDATNGFPVVSYWSTCSTGLHVDLYDMQTTRTQPDMRFQHPKGWADCQTVKRTDKKSRAKSCIS